MGPTAMKMNGYVTPSFVTKIDIGGLWECARTKLFRGRLCGIQIQRFHTEPKRA